MKWRFAVFVQCLSIINRGYKQNIATTFTNTYHTLLFLLILVTLPFQLQLSLSRTRIPLLHFVIFLSSCSQLYSQLHSFRVLIHLSVATSCGRFCARPRLHTHRAARTRTVALLAISQN